MRLIDADALEQKFSEIKHYLTKDLVMDAVYEINKAPTIDQVKHGNWIIDKSFIPFVSTCSNCGHISFVDGMWESNYCPNCGARMDGEV